MDVVHFKDMKPPAPSGVTEIGNGNLDWPKIMAACDEIGVKYAFIEQDNAVESDPLNCMKISHDYLAPLGAVLSFSQRITYSSPRPGRARRFCAKILCTSRFLRPKYLHLTRFVV